MSCLVMFASLLLFVQPGMAGVGDDCTNPVPYIDGSVATTEMTGGEIWFRYVAPETDEVGFVVQFPTSDLIAEITVFDGCGGSQVATAHGSNERLPAIVKFAALEGAAYVIRISNIQNVDGTTRLNQPPKIRACGDPGTGDCYVDNGSPECDDSCGGESCPDCCTTVCAIDAFCCDVEWDGICAAEAVDLCTIVPVELQSFHIE